MKHLYLFFFLLVSTPLSCTIDPDSESHEEPVKYQPVYVIIDQDGDGWEQYNNFSSGQNESEEECGTCDFLTSCLNFFACCASGPGIP